MRREISTGQVLTGGRQYAIVGYGIPLPGSFYPDVKFGCTLNRSNLHNEVYISNISKSVNKNTLIGIADPTIYVDDMSTGFYCLILFTSRVEIWSTCTALHNNIFGPY